MALRIPSPIILLTTILLAAAPRVPASAQCLLCVNDGATAEKSTANLRPLHISIEADLDFSRVTLGGNSGTSGNITIDPKTGARSLSGAARDLGGMAVRGIVRIEGEPGRAIRVDMPDQVELMGHSGGSAKVTDLRTNLSSAPRIGADGQLSFGFGGQLQITPGLSGELRGRIPIIVNYL